MVEVWDQACRLAGEQWHEAKTALDAQVLGLDAQLAAVAGERDAARTEIERLATAMDRQGATLRETQDVLDLASNALAARTEALAQARIQGEDHSRQQDHAERVAAASAESLKAALERIPRLQVEQEVATARAELLERAEATARDAAAQARADLEAAQALAGQLRGSVSERYGQLATLTATVQAEQQSRDADTQHWLSRLAEHQAAVAEARARETALTEEKKALTLEAHRLRQDLRKVQSGLFDDERARSAAHQG